MCTFIGQLADLNAIKVTPHLKRHLNSVKMTIYIKRILTSGPFEEPSNNMEHILEM